jgi:hypothetical protein
MERNEARERILKHVAGGGSISWDEIERNSRNRTEDNDQNMVIRDAIWDLHIEGILAPGQTDKNQGANIHFPWVRLTAYGKKLISTSEYNPHNNNEYLYKLQSKLPITRQLDAIIIDYLVESMSAMQKGLYKASAVMLGVATERALMLLVETAMLLPAAATVKKAFESNPFQTETLANVLSATLDQIIPKTRKDLKNSLDLRFGTIFHIIRITRNEAGHPKNVITTREDLLALFQLFPLFCERVYQLLIFFETELENQSQQV